MLDQLPPWMQESAVRSQLPAWMSDNPPPKKKAGPLDFAGFNTWLKGKLAALGPKAVEQAKEMAHEAVTDPRRFTMGMVGTGELGGGAAVHDLAGLIGKDANHSVLDVVRGLVRNKPMARISAVDAKAAGHMAKVYESLPKNDPAAKTAYNALNKEVAAQFKAIKKAGYKIEFVDKDPYANSAEMMKDVRENKRLQVYKTAADQQHPYMTPEQNDHFRAVHDWIAHAGPGNQFGPIGEENAYRMHAATLSPEAQQALATETRGQNSWVNFGPNAHLPVKERPFAEQKAALFPKELLGDYGTMPKPVPPKIGTPAIRVHVPGEKEPRVFTGPAHPFARNDAEDALGDLLDENFEPRFQIDEGFLADDMKTWLTRQEGLESAKYHKQLGGNAKAVAAVKRSGQMKAEALKQPDVYASAEESPAPASVSSPEIPPQEPLRYYVGLRTPESKLEQARQLAYKAFRPKGPYGKLAARGEKVKGAPNWYDTRKMFEEAEAAAPGSGAEQMNEILNMMAASTARGEPKGNLQRGIMWSVLNRLKMLDPAELRSGEKFPVPPRFGHMFQRRTHQPLVANVIEHGGLDPIRSPKGASFGGSGPHGTGNLGLNWLNPTLDDVMSKTAMEVEPRLKEFFDIKADPRGNNFISPKSQFYGPLAEGFTQAAEEAHKLGRVPLPHDALHPTAAYQAMGWMGKSPSASKGSLYDIFNLLRDESASMWGVSPEEATKLLFKEQRPFLLPLDYPLGGR